MRLSRAGICLLVSGSLTLSTAEAGQATTAVPAETPSDTPVLRIDGPPPAVQQIAARDAEGRVTFRAVRLTEPLRLDGKLDEALYTSYVPGSEFIQTEPYADAPATERTDVWISFDRRNVYVSFRVWESHPERMVLSEMRHDNQGQIQNEHMAFIFDTFYDRRNSYYFSVTANGARLEGQITNEREFNFDWNPVWGTATGKFDGGWTVETAIPFKSLRYPPGREQEWGFMARRVSRWKNEISHTAKVPPGSGFAGMIHTSSAGPLVGVEAPPKSLNLDVKPYATADLTTDRTVSPNVTNAATADLGLDVKYNVTQNLTADLTYNTDFAQVEADEQQINLTRFSLFFPEKREFFLENQGIFLFGSNPFGAGAGGDVPSVFYSRRVGLEAGRATPVEAGARLTGRLGPFDVGLLNIESGKDAASRSPATNFSVVRLRRNVLRRSSVGAIFTRRSATPLRDSPNVAYGVDGGFGFFQNLVINTYWARTHTDGATGDDTSYRAQLDYPGDRFGAQLEYLAVGANFNPEIGFVRRHDIRRSFGLFRYSPRPRAIKSVRKFPSTASMTYIKDGAGRLVYREAEGELAVEFQNSDRIAVGYSGLFEYLPAPFRIAPKVTVPVGGYDFTSGRVSLTLGQQRLLSGTATFDYGTFYNGHKKGLGLSRGRMRVAARFSLEPSLTLNWVDLPGGAFTTTLVGSRITYTMTPFMFTSALLQYNASTNSVAANVRLRWEYRPGSELFVVYNEQRDTLGHTFPDLANRAVIVKINRLLQF